MRSSNAAAFQAAAALDSYEARLRAMCEAGAIPGEVGGVQAEIRRLCGFCLQLPQLSASAVALLLAHQRFLVEFFRCEGKLSDPAVDGSLGHVRDRVQALRRACRPLLAAPGSMDDGRGLRTFRSPSQEEAAPPTLKRRRAQSTAPP